MRGTLIHLFEGDIHTYERVSMHTGCGSVHTTKSATAKGCGLPHRKGHSHTHKHQRVIHTFIRVSTHMDAYLHICQDIDTYRLTMTLMEGNQHIWRAHTFIMILIHSRNIHTYRKTLTYVVRNKTNKEGIQTFRIQTASSPMGVHTYNGTSTHTLVQGMCGRHLHK